MLIQFVRGLLIFAVGLTTSFGMETPHNTLVLGGTGRLGAEIVTLLTTAGHPVTVFARPSSDRSRLKNLPVNYIVGDLLDGPGVFAELNEKRFDYVIDASARGPSNDPFYGDVMKNILTALQASEVQQFILHGSIGAGNSADVFTAAMYKRMRKVMQAKTEAENLLIEGGIPYTIIRNGVIKLDGTAATSTALLTEDVTKMGTVTRPDLATLTMQCLGSENCLNRTFHALDASWESDPGY